VSQRVWWAVCSRPRREERVDHRPHDPSGVAGTTVRRGDSGFALGASTSLGLVRLLFVRSGGAAHRPPEPRLSPQSQHLGFHAVRGSPCPEGERRGQAVAAGQQEQSEEGRDGTGQGEKHHPGSRSVCRIVLFRRVLSAALPGPNPQQPQALRVFTRDRIHWPCGGQKERGLERSFGTQA
jgi:hypothetical protein